MSSKRSSKATSNLPKRPASGAKTKQKERKWSSKNPANIKEIGNEAPHSPVTAAAQEVSMAGDDHGAVEAASHPGRPVGGGNVHLLWGARCFLLTQTQSTCTEDPFY